ncbi:MAG: glycosyltransferase family 2 protein [Hyphomicrobiales bacterium]|nr:glycosyltransferase family 2 protein [Hyphomicrobiales bacterium]
MSAPRVSVVTAAFNAAGHIASALESVARQTCTDWELIVVDDGSTDSTADVVQGFAARDSRVRYRRLARNAGVAAARNAALGMARGDWVTVLDSDDAYAPDRLQTLLDRAESDGLDIVADNLLLHDAAKDVVVCKAFGIGADACALTRERLVMNDGPPRIASLGHLKPFVRRAFLERSGVLYPADARLGEDFCFLFFLLERTDRAKLLDYAGYRYTLPFSLDSGARAPGTRTPYGSDGLEDLRRTNLLLRNRVALHWPAETGLVALLEKRSDDLRHEGAWREARRSFRLRRYFDAARILARIDPTYRRAQLAALVRHRNGRFQTSLS